MSRILALQRISMSTPEGRGVIAAKSDTSCDRTSCCGQTYC